MDVLFLTTMLYNFTILNLFENAETLIIEVECIDLPNIITDSHISQWLYLDKVTFSMIKLWLNSVNSSSDVEERYFQQGYLKFNNFEATFIEKYNLSQNQLLNNKYHQLPNHTHQLIQEYLRQPISWKFL
ncbi:hypothetical protein [Pedobacter sp. Leaf250]|uniref:hypothetical protein n=1 Tax=Pedobacter sp. Leaf250 TaxID=2876559 RepID=UPI001E4352FA|nr:hypothetical protein [Pedobacter sp. Leaf250]